MACLAKPPGLYGPETGQAHKTIIISNDDCCKRVLTKYFNQSVSYSYTELAEATDWNDTTQGVSLMWFDLPTGKAKATKMEQVGTIIDKVINEQDNTAIACLVPFDKKHVSFPHHRWSRILQKWKPATRTICTCQILKREATEGLHNKYRLYASGCQIRWGDCSNVDSDWPLCRGKRQEFLRRIFLDGYLKVGVPELLGTKTPARVGKWSKFGRKPGVTPGHLSQNVNRRSGRAKRSSGDGCAAQLDLACEHRAVLTHLDSGAQDLPDSTHNPTNPNTSDTPFPTDSKERQNEQKKRDKEAGIERVVIKKRKIIEDHHDDCGESLDSLTGDIDEADFAHSDSDSGTESDALCDGLHLHYLWGSAGPDLSHLQLTYFDTWDQTFAVLRRAGPGIDIAEVCGGEGRTSSIAIRRRLRSGRNLDLVHGCDLTKPEVRQAGYNYFKNNRVLVAVMAPVCGPFGPLSHLNWHLHPETMRRQEAKYKPLAVFCGNVALIQHHKGLHWLQEQPHPSRLYSVPPWPKVLGLPGVCRVIYHRCTCGLKVLAGKWKGKFIKKPSSMTASDLNLIEPFRGCVCKHSSDQHLQDIGHSAEHSAAQLWTWNEAERIVKGILNLRKAIRYLLTFPTTEEPVQRTPLKVEKGKVAQAQPGGDPERATMGIDELKDVDDPCKACIARWAKDHWCHTRVIGKCRWPYTPPWEPTCEGCWRFPGYNRPTDGHDGTPGCWWSGRAPRQPTPRFGHHPRDGRKKASADSTADYRGAPKGKELGKEIEEEVERQVERSRSIPQTDEPEGIPESKPSGSSSSSAGERKAPAPKAPAPTDGKVGGEGVADPDDWTHFDIRRVLRTLRMTTPAQARMTLRKLHIRWWHASAEAMQKLLGRAGVPKEVTDFCNTIVETCRVCREWAKPQPENVANVDFADKFNQDVEADLMFHDSFIIFHLIDRCTRWYHSILVKDRHDSTLIAALNTWVHLHGAMTNLFMDQETAIQASAETLDYMSRNTINYVPRAKGQQVPYIDRRGALVRGIINKMVSQLKVEKIKVPFEQVLAQATFASNALLTVNQSTPYNAVYGRVPKILPDINQPDAPNEGVLSSPGLIRHTFRLREIAVESMVQETAKVRAERALNTRSLPAGQREDYKMGERVDFYRPSSTKEASGWIGPAKVLDPTHMHRGTVTIKHIHRPIEVRVGDLRKHIAFWLEEACMHWYSAFGQTQRAWTECRLDIQNKIPKGTTLHIGLSPEGNMLEKSVSWLPFLYGVGRHFGQMLGERISAIRIGHACAVIRAIVGYDRCITVFWHMRHPETLHKIFHTEHNSVGHVNFRNLSPDEWEHWSFCQLFIVEGCSESDLTKMREPSKPSATPAVGQCAPPPGLPPIPEGEPGEETEDEHVMLFKDDDLNYEVALAEANKYGNCFKNDVPMAVDKDTDPDLIQCPYQSCQHSYLYDMEIPKVPRDYHEIRANVLLERPAYDAWPEEDCLEIYYENNMHKIMRLDADDQVFPGPA